MNLQLTIAEHKMNSRDFKIHIVSLREAKRGSAHVSLCSERQSVHHDNNIQCYMGSEDEKCETYHLS